MTDARDPAGLLPDGFDGQLLVSRIPAAQRVLVALPSGTCATATFGPAGDPPADVTSWLADLVVLGLLRDDDPERQPDAADDRIDVGKLRIDGPATVVLIDTDLGVAEVLDPAAAHAAAARGVGRTLEDAATPGTAPITFPRGA